MTSEVRIGLVLPRVVGLAVLLGGLSLGTAPVSQASASDVHIHSAVIRHINAISCPSLTTCFAVGDVTPSTWPPKPPTSALAFVVGANDAIVRQIAVPASVGSLPDIACGSTEYCVALGRKPHADSADELVVTNDAGTTWRVESVPRRVSYLDQVACLTPLTCIAVGDGIITTSDGGLSWRVVPAAGGSLSLSSIACSGATTCLAVGLTSSLGPAVARSVDGGRVWSVKRSVSEIGTPVRIACPTSKECFGVGTSAANGSGVITVSVSTDFGVRWNPEHVPSAAGVLTDIACATAASCVAVSGGNQDVSGPLTTSDGGKTWQLEPHTYNLYDVSCLRDGRCFAVGGWGGPTVLRSNDSGKQWSKRYPVPPDGLPGPPRIGALTVYAGQAAVTITVSWTAPSSDGGHRIVRYTVTASPGGKTCTRGAGPLECTITGLTLTCGVTYTFTVTATNVAGTGPASAPSGRLTRATLPGPPRGVDATSGDGSALVSWSAPASNGCSTVTSYIAIASPGGNGCTWSSGPLECTVTGLTNGVAYTFTVTATSARGIGPPSAPSPPVIPDTVPDASTKGNSSLGGPAPIVPNAEISPRIFGRGSPVLRGQ